MIQVKYKDKNIIKLIEKREKIKKLLKRNKKLAFDCKIIYDNESELATATLIFNILINGNTEETTKSNK